MNLDDEQVETLSKSMAKVGQLNRVIVCLQHDDFIISGRHRSKAGARNVFKWDVDETAKRLGVSHGLCHLVMREHANFQRTISEEERREEFVEMAKILVEEGTSREDVCARLCELSAFSDQYVRRLLPGEFKRAEMVRTRIAKPVAQAQPSAEPDLESNARETHYSSTTEKSEPYRRGVSPSLRQNNPAHLTGSHVRLFELIHRIPGTRFLNEEVFRREGEFTKDGIPKSYQTDIVDHDLKLVVEAMGKGSSSEDPARDRFFVERGFQVLKFTNEEIEKAPRLVRECTVLKVENIRLRQVPPEEASVSSGRELERQAEGKTI